MKKRIVIYLLCGIIIFFVAALVLFDFTKDKKENTKTTKVTLADTTLTSRTYMN